jgi:tRNA uridine 5-carbamoylmethylation protein Kti12
MKTLTKRQIERQDFVDNEIFELLQKFLPPSKTMKWDIEAIGAIRDAIQEQIVDKQKLMGEVQFYPYIKT